VGVSELRARGVQLVACSFVDHAGIARAFSVPVERFESALETGVGASTAFGGFQGDDGMADVRVDGASIRETDLRLVPDPSSLAGGPDGWAWVATDQYGLDGSPWPLCARHFLRRQVAELERADLRLSLAYELEWYAERMADGRPLHEQPAYGLTTLRDVGTYLRVIAERLAAHGLTIEKIHSEYVVGQVEVSLTPLPPVEACDAQVLARHVIQTAKETTGVRASFSPITKVGSFGTGMHLHFSCWEDSENLFGVGPEPFGVSTKGRSFMAGVLRDLRAIVALGCSSPLSYLRVGPGLWTGAFTAWGVDNREIALRLIRGWYRSRPQASHVEIRPLDGTGNPYLVVGALIAAGLAGIRDGLDLGEPVAGDPAALPEDERRRRHISPLPATLEEAADALESSADVCAALGAPLVDAIALVRRGQAASSSELSTDQQVEFYRWRY
jgi:glutamine synthetase